LLDQEKETKRSQDVADAPRLCPFFENLSVQLKLPLRLFRKKDIHRSTARAQHQGQRSPSMGIIVYEGNF